MPEDKRLELTSAITEEGYDKLDELADKLDDVDDEIKETGSNVGDDDVVVDVEVHAADAITELEAVDAAIDDIDRQVTVDVEKDGLDSSDVPSPGDGDGGGSGMANAPDDPSANAVTGGGRDISDIPDDPLEAAPSEVGGDFDVGREETLEEKARRLSSMERGGIGVTRDPTRLNALPPRASDTDENTPIGKVAGSLRKNEIPFKFVSNDLQREQLFGAGGQSIEAAMSGPSPFDGDNRRLRSQLISGIRNTTEEFKDFQFTASSLNEILAASFPLLVLFAGALPAAIAGVAALGSAALVAAGALTAIGGLGAMGLSLQQTGQVSTEPIANELQGVQTAFVDAFAPLARQFAPLIRDAITQVEMMMGPLARASEGLLQFRDEFRGVVDFITTNLPGAISTALDFAHAVTPLVSSVVNFIADQDILGFLASQLREALPALAKIAQTLASLVPAIVMVSQGFLDFLSIISVFVDFVVFALNNVPFLAQALGILAGALLTLVTISTVYTLVTEGAIASALGFAKAQLVSAKSSIAAALGVESFTASLITAASVLALVVIPIMFILFDVLAGINDQLEKARENLEKFSKERDRITSGVGVGADGGAAAVYNDNSTVVVDGAGSPHDRARSQYSAEYEHSQRVDSVFGN